MGGKRWFSALNALFDITIDDFLIKHSGFP